MNERRCRKIQKEVCDEDDEATDKKDSGSDDEESVQDTDDAREGRSIIDSNIPQATNEVVSVADIKEEEEEETEEDPEASEAFLSRDKARNCVTVYQRVCSEPVIDFYMFIKGSCKVVEKVDCGPQVSSAVIFHICKLETNLIFFVRGATSPSSENY